MKIYISIRSYIRFPSTQNARTADDNNDNDNEKSEREKKQIHVKKKAKYWRRFNKKKIRADNWTEQKKDHRRDKNTSKHTYEG